MKETYRFFIDAGADAVINHHQHCYSGYEIYNEKPIFYGIGNFLFDRKGVRDSIWNEGDMVLLTFDPKSVQFELFPYSQGTEELGVKVLHDKTKFQSVITELNRIIADDIELRMHHKAFMDNSKFNYLPSFEPYQNR